MGTFTRAWRALLPHLVFWRDRTDFNLTVLALLYFLFCGFWACFANSYADRVSLTNKLPISDKYSAPDVIVDALKPLYMSNRWIPRNIPDILVVIAALSALAMCLAQKELSCLVFRRFAVLVSTLYLVRAPMIALTVLPSPFHFCIANYDENIWWDTLKLMAQMRISCGDVFFSGHTILFTSSYFVYRYHCPSQFLTAAVGVLTIIGMFSLLLATYHYTIDVVIGFMLTGGFWMAYIMAVEVEALRDTALGRAVAFWENGIFARSDDVACVGLPSYQVNGKAHQTFRRSPQQIFNRQREFHYHPISRDRPLIASKSWTPREAGGDRPLYASECPESSRNPMISAVTNGDVPRSIGGSYWLASSIGDCSGAS